jgi:NADH-quinone oxidoreductase subunit D
VNRDVRRDDPYAAYADVKFKVITDNHNDVYGRTLVRMGELLEAYSIIRQIIKKMPEGPIITKVPRKIPAGEAVSRYEAPRGEDMHYVKANGTEKPERVKVRAPTLANIQTVAKMLEDRQLADLPIVIAAIDPCFSCTDRLTGIKYKGKRKKSVLRWEELHSYSIQYYREHGVDFTELNKRVAKLFK